MMKNEISLAQWALVDEFRSGKWKTLDFPKIAREDFDIKGIELVNTLFEVPTYEYLTTLKGKAADYGVEMVLIMVDDEGDGCAPEKSERDQFVINHRKWIDIANFLGCHAIRTNCRGIGVEKSAALNIAAETYHRLLIYASEAAIKVVIENHGGLSNDPDWMTQLVKTVDHPLFGTYPDWREPADDFDNVAYLEKTVAFAKGMSFRNQPTEEGTKHMIEICQNAGYAGWYGIESDGREAIKESRRILLKYLFPE